MGISFDKDMRIAGYRPATFKDGLRGFLRTKSPGCMIDLKSEFPQRRDGAIVFEECLDRGLIELRDQFELTANGETIARGKAKQRTSLAKAQALLAEFLERVHALNEDEDAVRFVDEVWLFGSALRGSETVGDIDLALVTQRRPQFAERSGYEKMRAHLKKILAKRNDVPQTQGLFWSAEYWLTERALFGAKRHPLLVGVQEDTSDLADLAVPCRLVYDRSKGGRVENATLDRHPSSKGRRNDVDPPAEMPDLTPSDLRPMDARWVAGFTIWGGVSPYDIFRAWNDEAHGLFSRYPEDLRIAGDDFDPFKTTPWLPKCLKKRKLDGRDAIALINANEFWGTSVVLRRQIEQSGDPWTLHAWFEDLELFRRRRIDEITIPDLASSAALILAVDAERMLRRSAETATHPRVRIKVRYDQADKAAPICELALSLLEKREIRIEPVGWTGEPAIIQRV